MCTYRYNRLRINYNMYSTLRIVYNRYIDTVDYKVIYTKVVK